MLATLMLTGCTTHQIAEIIMQCLPLRNAVKGLFVNDVNEQCQKLCNRSAENSSVLRTPPSKHKELKSFSWEKVITEMKECLPGALDVLAAAAAIPNVTAHEDSAKQIAPLCTAYGKLMFTRWKELSLIQKMNSILFSTGHATERVFNVSQLTLLSCALLQPHRGFKEQYCTQYDYECGIPPESTKHTHACTT